MSCNCALLSVLKSHCFYSSFGFHTDAFIFDWMFNEGGGGDIESYILKSVYAVAIEVCICTRMTIISYLSLSQQDYIRELRMAA